MALCFELEHRDPPSVVTEYLICSDHFTLQYQKDPGEVCHQIPLLTETDPWVCKHDLTVHASAAPGDLWSVLLLSSVDIHTRLSYLRGREAQLI